MQNIVLYYKTKNGNVERTCNERGGIDYGN